MAHATPPIPSQDRAELHHILKSKSVRFGHFTLASGKTSDVYVDCRLTTYDPHAMPLIGRLFLRKIAEKNWSPEAVGGLTLGADPIAFAIARESIENGDDRSAHRAISCFVVRKERKAHGMQKMVEGLDTVEGRKVVILDDVCTTGESTALAIENARSAGMQVLGAVCLIDRESGAREMLREKFGVELESIFSLSDFRK